MAGMQTPEQKVTAKQRQGRPSKRTEANAIEIVNTIELGGTRRMACALVGISEDTLARWAASNADFAERLKTAESRRDRALVVNIRTAAAKDWKAAAWLLERVAREDYGTNKVEVTGKDGGPIKHDHVTRDMTGFSDAEIDSLAAIAERVKQGVS